MSQMFPRLLTALRRFVLVIAAPIKHHIMSDRLGSVYGGWIIPRDIISSTSVCYCFGVGEDASFDIELTEKYMCNVFSFDPTPRSIEYARKILKDIPLIHFVPRGLWIKDDKVRFYAPAEANHVSHSIDNLQGTETFFEAECRRLTSFMNDLGHTKIDLLKMDIEGAEYAVIEDILQERIPITVLLVEFNQPAPLARISNCIRSLYQAGFALVAREGWNYTFLNKSFSQSR